MKRISITQMKKKTSENRAIGKEEEEEKAVSAIWDCGSPLYDSFELVSLSHLIERHLMVLPSLGSARVSPSSDVVRVVRFVDVADCKCEEKGSSSIIKMLAGFLGRKGKPKKKVKTRIFGCCNFNVGFGKKIVMNK
ncbi:hypothetical protein SLEP1_g9914 [Rubroshorea leprosula]|uniref:Uncharacterized protein n=2 Tax=Rubroshorea leprosula TaxID=152421 RepID=A0AAV5IFT8_9ROSI|nr:hypothetical protein SLEP1_g9914 [Rubroshorea leprosula]